MMNDVNPEDVRARHQVLLRSMAAQYPTPNKVAKALGQMDQEHAALRDRLNAVMDDGYAASRSQRRWKLERKLDDWSERMDALRELAEMYQARLTDADDA